jgi:hypothetical protein
MKQHIFKSESSIKGNGDHTPAPFSNTQTAMVQPKLEISDPDDKYEKEADEVADQVMRMPDTGPVFDQLSIGSVPGDQLQRQAEEEEEEEEELIQP